MKWWQSSPAEGSAVPRAAFQGCSRSFLVWSLRWCQRQPPPFLTQSRGPETPCDTTSCPRGAQACGWGRATCYRGHISPHRHRPPVPAAPRAAWRGPALSNPGHKAAGRPGEGILASPARQEGRAAKCSGRCHTRQQSSHSAECHTTDGDMQRDTAQSDRPTAQPDAEVSEAPARADTFAHLETAGLRGSNLEIFLWLCESSGKHEFEPRLGL